MKIYFAGSIHGGRGDVEWYHKMIGYLAKHGTVLTEHLGNPNITSNGENLPPKHIFQRDVKWLTESDAVVAEVTTPSLGVGYELGLSEFLKKPTLCLYRTGKGRSLTSMVLGNGKLTVREYDTLETAFRHIDEFFASLGKSAPKQ